MVCPVDSTGRAKPARDRRIEEALWARWAAGDVAARDALFTYHQGLVFFSIGQMRRRPWWREDFAEDYSAVGDAALLHAIERWPVAGDPARGAFSTFTITAIRRAIWRAHRGLASGRGPRDVVSLDKPILLEDGDKGSLHNVIPDPRAEAPGDGQGRPFREEIRRRVVGAVLAMEAAFRRAVILRYWHGWTWRQVRRAVGYSRQRYHQVWQGRLKDRLRSALCAAFGGIPHAG